MKLFNTLTNKKEDFKPLREGEVSIYVCGPTVYNYVHIGNTRPMIVFDVLRRTFEYLGYKVTFVSNFTDVDDKIIKAAKEEGITEKELTDKYIKAYEDVRRDLNLLFPTYAPRVTNTMDAIINFIDGLVKDGYAYEVDGDVYFRVSKIKEYGQLSGIKIEDLVAGASDRVDENDKKEESTDFALWKKTDEGIQFDSPWSKGRPGWHTECVVMINDIFEDGKIDIHGGGQDLKFPHHENEIAQSEAANGCQFAKYWLHNGFITVDNEKMSKSLGNFFTVRDIAAQFPYEVIRFFILNGHYRSPINFSRELMQACQNGLERIKNARKELDFYIKNSADTKMTEAEKEEAKELETYQAQFEAAMDDDFNTADAVSVIYELVRFSNIAVKAGVSKEYAQQIQDMLDHLCGVLGVAELKEEVVSDEDTAKIEELIAKRAEAKQAKDFAAADAIRDELAAMGITIKDTRQGVQWFRS